MARSRFIRLILAAVALSMVAPTAGITALAAETGQVGLRNCHLTVDFLSDSDGQRMYREGWLPKGQKLAILPGFPPGKPGSASLTIWVFDCRAVGVNGKPAGPAMLSLTAIQIQDRPQGAWPTHWDNYLVWSQTNNVALAKALRNARLPVATVPRMRFAWRTNGDLTTASVPWSSSPYSLQIRGTIEDAPHVHDNTFQHGPTPGAGPKLGLVVDPLVPRDRFCHPAVQADCMRITAKPGSRMERFLGRAAYTLGADHEVITRAQLNLFSD